MTHEFLYLQKPSVCLLLWPGLLTVLAWSPLLPTVLPSDPASSFLPASQSTHGFLAMFWEASHRQGASCLGLWTDTSDNPKDLFSQQVGLSLGWGKAICYNLG